MTATIENLLSLVSARAGHFRLESGYHGTLWLDLDTLFAEPIRVRPFVSALAQQLRAHDVASICGPLVGGAFLAQMLAADLGVEFTFAERWVPAHPEGLYRVEYRIPPALRGRLHGRRVAIVDDVVSAGSAVRGTYADLRRHGARPVVVGSLLALGSATAAFFANEGVAVVSVLQRPYDLFPPAKCPLCAAGTPVEDAAVPAEPKP